MKTSFSPFPSLKTERLLLRPLEESDAPEILVHRSDERITRFTDSPKALDLDAALLFILSIQERIENGNSAVWAICLHGEDKLIGTICIWNFDPERSVAEVGFTLHPDFWGQGIATEALAAVIEFGFSQMEAEVLEAAAQHENFASIRLLERVGFVRIGKEDAYTIFALCRPPLGSMVLETERLQLREIMPSDAPFLLELLNSPGWLKNIGDRHVRTVEEANKYLIYRIFLVCRTKGFSFYVLQKKLSNERVGICGLIKRDFMECVDIGYALLPTYYRQGYAIEAAQGVISYARQHLKLPSLAAIVVETNLPSINLLEKLGMGFERKIAVPPDGEELMLFSMDL
ncbi:MAG: GNAT family N-acetyltransferase [Saprospiraceae bacterium]|nr:GNAT family N-acetyltransferase [Saprospiraceae bacterium]